MADDPLSKAVVAASQRHRKSLTARLSVAGDEELDEDKKQMLQSASRRHRQSISKVADVLEDAEVEDEKADVLDKKMAIVQKCMEDALKKHRQSIVQAVQELEKSPEKEVFFSPDAKEFTPQAFTSPTKAKPQFNADAADFTPQGKKLSFNAEAAAFTPDAGSRTPQAATTMGWAEESPCAGAAWQQPQNPYSKIHQAMSSAFDHHCQTYGDDWSQGYGGSANDWQQSQSYQEYQGGTTYYSSPSKPQVSAYESGGSTYYDAPAAAKKPTTGLIQVGGCTYFEEPTSANNQAGWNNNTSMDGYQQQGAGYEGYGSAGWDNGMAQNSSYNSYDGSGFTSGDGGVYYDQAGYQQQQQQAGYGQAANCWSGGDCWSGDQSSYACSSHRQQPWRLAA